MLNIKYVGCTRPLALAKLIHESICSPYSLDRLVDLGNADYTSYLSAPEDIDYNATSRDFALDSLSRSYLKKLPNFEDPSREQRTLDLFMDCEAQCRDTNQRLEANDLGHFHDEFNVMKGKIASILGDIPHTLEFAFGPGVSIGRKGIDTGNYAKYSVYRPSVTDKAAAFAETYLNNTLWGDYLKRGHDNRILFEYVNAAEIAFVPKNFKILRTIAIEPLMNTYFQKGFGGAIRDKLKRVGVDIRQQTLNQEAAREARDRGDATVDMKSASDTVSRMLVAHSVPIDWYVALDTFRSPLYKLPDGTKGVFEKFSSMGNGFTFELESLLFYAMAYAIVKTGSGYVDRIHVYGDDVIIPQEDYPRFFEFSKILGFTVNTDKTFASGEFFESCGMDFYGNVNVRPLYLKNDLRFDFDIYECHNSLLRFSERWKVDFSRAIALLQSFIPAKRRLYVPFPYSGGFWTRLDRDFGITDQGWEGSYHKALMFKSKTFHNKNYEPSILHSLSSPSNGTRSARKTGKYVVKKTFFPAVS